MGSHRIFCDGAPFCGAQYGDRADVQRIRRRRQAHYLLDFAHPLALDIKAAVESVP